MSLSDPQSVNIGAGAVTLPRLSTGPNTSTYRSADNNLELVYSHTYGKRTRRVARVNIKKLAADPLYPAQNSPFTMAVYQVVDVPLFGFTTTEVVAAMTGLMTQLTAATNANAIKLAGGEN